MRWCPAGARSDCSCHSAFPLQTVLFPGGALPLKIFEQRYMDMAKACLSAADGDDAPFGVLQVLVHGGERFRIKRHWAEPSGEMWGLLRVIVADLGDPLSALAVIRQYLAQKKLLKD